MSRLYNVEVDGIGTVTIEAENIRAARKDAKKRFRAGPRCVSPHAAAYVHCERCDSRPCCCGRPL